MLRHYLVISARSMFQHKLYSLINVVGLSVALACAILLLIFVRDQLWYDNWIPGTENLYQLEVTWHLPRGQTLSTVLSPLPMANAMKSEIPGVTAVTHLVPEQMTVTAGDRQFPETVMVVDPNFLQVIELPLFEGEPAQVLAEPDSIVLSQSMARKHFDNSDPVGKLIRVGGASYGCKPSVETCFSVIHTLKVSGVLRDLPHNTSLIADFLVPNTSQADEISSVEKQGAWMSTYDDVSYIRLMPSSDPARVLRELKAINRVDSWRPSAAL